jgi:hypothetical protein
MNPKRTSHGFAQDGGIIDRIEGMEIEFDEKVTLFPVDLEEIRDLVPRATTRPSRRSGTTVH